MNRPGSVNMIGVTYVLLAVLLLFSAAFLYLAGGVLQNQAQEINRQLEEFTRQARALNLTVPTESDQLAELVDSLSRRLGDLSLVSLALAPFILFISIQFLRLRSWSLPAMEIVNGLGLALIVWGGIKGMNTLPDLIGRISFADPGLIPQPEEATRLVRQASVVLIAVLSLPNLVFVFLLRGKTLRAAFTGAAAGPPPENPAGTASRKTWEDVSQER